MKSIDVKSLLIGTLLASIIFVSLGAAERKKSEIPPVVAGFADWPQAGTWQKFEFNGGGEDKETYLINTKTAQIYYYDKGKNSRWAKLNLPIEK